MVKDIQVKISDDGKQATLDITTFESDRFTVTWTSCLWITAVGKAGEEMGPSDDSREYKDLD